MKITVRADANQFKTVTRKSTLVEAKRFIFCWSADRPYKTVITKDCSLIYYRSNGQEKAIFTHDGGSSEGVYIHIMYVDVYTVVIPILEIVLAAYHCTCTTVSLL